MHMVGITPFDPGTLLSVLCEIVGPRGVSVDLLFATGFHFCQ